MVKGKYLPCDTNVNDVTSLVASITQKQLPVLRQRNSAIKQLMR